MQKEENAFIGPLSMDNKESIFVQYEKGRMYMRSGRNPQLYLIGGPNGAGKTTSARALLPELLQCEEYVNADSIAAGISPFQPNEVSIQAGKIMLKRIKELAEKRRDFAFETTMASKTFATLLRRCRLQGYGINLVFVWLQNVELAVQRVRQRVKNGGHQVNEKDIRRRYKAGISNFLKIYLPLTDSWIAYDNSGPKPILVATKHKDKEIEIADCNIWERMEKCK